VNSPATINVPQGTSVGALILNSPVNIEGSGSLGKVIIATPGVVIDNPPAEVIILEGVTAIIGGQEQTGTASPEEIREAIEDVQQQPPAPAPAPAPGGGGGGGGVDQVSKAISAVNSVNREDMLEVLNANAKVLGLDFKDLTEGGRREAVADFVYFVKWVKGDYRTVTELKEAFNKSVTTETHKMNFIRLVNETNEENAASELTTVLGQLKADAEAFLDEFEKDKIDEYYGYEFSKGLEEVIVLMEIYLDLNDKDKKNVAKKFIENDYSGSDVVAMGYLKTAIETLSTVITAVDFSVKVAEEKEFTVRVDNFTEDYESVLFKFVVTSESNETNVQKRDITLFQYKDGNAWKDMPLAEEDGKLVGYFGPQTGFPMNKGYSANTQFKVKMGKSGTYNVTISLVDLNNGEAVLASDTMIVNVSAPNLDGFDQT
jgi:uncharacterized protein YifE (UPF0438 family)